MSRKQLVPYSYSPTKLGLSGVTLAAQRTSNPFYVSYRENIDIKVNLTSRSAATAVLVIVEAFDEDLNAWIPVQSGNIASGTDTLSDFTFSKAVSGVDNFNCFLALDCNYDLIRLKVSGTSGAAGDVVSVSARVS